MMKKLLLLLGLGLAASCVRAQSLPDGQWAVVNASSAYMRAENRYSSECVSQTRMGTLVRVLEQKGYWVRVRTPEPYEGWINEVALAPLEAISPERQRQLQEWGPKLLPLPAAEAQKYLSSPKYICTAEYTHVYEQPSEEAGRICDLLMSDIVRKGDASGREGWLEVVLPQGVKGWVKEAEVADFKQFASSRVASAESIIALARQFLGVPYFWGGMSVKGFDCSGLTGFCYFMNGVLLPRDASEQIKCGEKVPSLEDAQPGDLVFFGNTSVGHVAIYMGDGKIIHSSQTVRINSLYPSESGYYGRNILGIRRIIGSSEGCSSLSCSPLYFSR